MGDYPIPVDTTDDLGPIFCDILKALDLMGFRDGFMDVILYSEQQNYDKKKADIVHPCLPQRKLLTTTLSFALVISILVICNRNFLSLFIGESYSGLVFKVPDITLHMIYMASYIGPGPVNCFVIAKPQTPRA